MVSAQIREINGIKYVYLVQTIRLGKKTKTIEKIIGKHTISKKEIKRKVAELESFFVRRTILLKAEYISTIVKSDYLSKEDIFHLEIVKACYNVFIEGLYPSELDAYKEQFSVRYVYNTTNIEGNTLTLRQTKLVLVDDVTPSEKELREIHEVKNYEKVIEYINKYGGDITAKFMKILHCLIQKNIDQSTLGEYRRVDVAISGSELVPTPAILIEDTVESLVRWYNKNKKTLHPIELATILHHKFEQIHPFTNGNGRVGRELFNFILKKFNFPPLIFEVKKRLKYLEVLHGADSGQMKGISDFIVDSLWNQNWKIIKSGCGKCSEREKCATYKLSKERNKP